MQKLTETKQILATALTKSQKGLNNRNVCSKIL